MLKYTAKRFSALAAYQNYENFNILSPSKYVYNFEINRPEFKNAMNMDCWNELEKLFNQADKDPNCRAIILTGKKPEDDSKPVFCAGIDIGSLASELNKCFESEDPSRRFFLVRSFVKEFQAKISSIENCKKPVIAAVTGAAVGGAIDILSACDIRYCDKSAWFTIKEVDVGLAADIGTLQRFGKIIGNESTYKELAFTARNFDANEAKDIGFVSAVADSNEILMNRVNEIAETIAEKSPVAVQGTKVAINYARDHSVHDSLEQIATWNGAALLTEDVIKSAMAIMEKKPIKEIEYEDV